MRVLRTLGGFVLPRALRVQGSTKSTMVIAILGFRLQGLGFRLQGLGFWV